MKDIHHINLIFQKPTDIPISSHNMSESEIRQRRGQGQKELEETQKADEMEDEGGEDTDKKGDDVKEEVELGPGTYWLTRVLFLRYLGFIYLVAFLISFHQNKELIGSRGLTPASNYLLNSESSDSHHTVHYYYYPIPSRCQSAGRLQPVCARPDPALAGPPPLHRPGHSAGRDGAHWGPGGRRGEGADGVY